jgi:putative CocE/NonD family hydrolase
VTYQRLFRHPSRDQEWDRLDADVRYEEITIPMMHWGGWWDVHTHGTIAGWRRVRERSASPQARSAQWLVLSGTDHELSTEFTGRAGRVAIRGHGYAHDRVLRFMDGVLKADQAAPGGTGTLGDAFRDTPRVQYFVVGRDEWRGADDWPPSGVETVPFYLCGDGTAAAGAAGAGALAAAPPDSAPPDEYTYDPADPVGAWVGRDVWALAEELDDRCEVESRPDILVYTGEALERELEVTGPLRVRLFASSSASDTDFTATLVDVFPDGYAQLVWEGIVRARFRESERDPSLIERGAVYQYQIDLASVSYAFAPGHSLRLEVSSSNFDRYDRNQNTGEPYGRTARLEVARQAIYHDRERPTALLLAVRRGA